MDCYLEEHLPKEHADPRASERVAKLSCPIFDRQICLWCCLHIHDVADPLQRNRAGIFHPGYAEKAPELSERDLDGIWETCSRCQHR